MSTPSFVLYHGDPYRCRQALRERETAVAAIDSACERRALFAPEVDPGSLEIELQSASLFVLGRHFIFRQVDKLRAPAAKRWAAMLEQTLSPGTYVTLLAGNLRATHPVLKLCKKRGVAEAFPAPKRQGVAAAARQILDDEGVSIHPRGVEELISRAGGDLLAIAQEAHKLRCYAPDGDIAQKAIEDLVFPAAEQTVFPFYDRIGEKNLPAALRTLDEVRDDAGRIVNGIVRHLGRLTMIRLLLSRRVANAQIASWTGCQEWLVRKLAAQAKRFSLQELTTALDLGVRLDVKIKSGGIASSDALLELLLAVTRPAPHAPG